MKENAGGSSSSERNCFLLCNCNVIGASRPRIGVSTQNPGLKLIVVVVEDEDDDDDGGTAKKEISMKFSFLERKRFTCWCDHLSNIAIYCHITIIQAS